MIVIVIQSGLGLGFYLGFWALIWDSRSRRPGKDLFMCLEQSFGYLSEEGSFHREFVVGGFGK